MNTHRKNGSVRRLPNIPGTNFPFASDASAASSSPDSERRRHLPTPTHQVPQASAPPTNPYHPFHSHSELNAALRPHLRPSQPNAYRAPPTLEQRRREFMQTRSVDDALELGDDAAAAAAMRTHHRPLSNINSTPMYSSQPLGGDRTTHRPQPPVHRMRTVDEAMGLEDIPAYQPTGRGTTRFGIRDEDLRHHNGENGRSGGAGNQQRSLSKPRIFKHGSAANDRYFNLSCRGSGAGGRS